jgi:hypothetical protein
MINTIRTISSKVNYAVSNKDTVKPTTASSSHKPKELFIKHELFQGGKVRGNGLPAITYSTV